MPARFRILGKSKEQKKGESDKRYIERTNKKIGWVYSDQYHPEKPATYEVNFSHKGIKIIRRHVLGSPPYFVIHDGGEVYYKNTKAGAMRFAEKIAKKRTAQAASMVKHKRATGPRPKRTIMTQARKVALFRKRK